MNKCPICGNETDLDISVSDTTEFIHRSKVEAKIKAYYDITRSTLVIPNFRQMDLLDAKIEVLKELLD